MRVSSLSLKTHFDENIPANSGNTLHQLKVKIFCGLHNPAGVYRVYHSFLLLTTLFNCFVLNVMIDFYGDDSKNKLMQAIAFFDCFVLTVLLIEITLRFYCANCVDHFGGLDGRFKYLKEYRCTRLYDLLCVAILLGYLCAPRSLLIQANQRIQCTFRTLHFVLLLQFYRLFGKVFRTFATVVW